MAGRAQLQVNQGGAWRAVLDFNLLELPSEFLYHVDQMLRIAGTGEKGRARIVAMQPNDRGGYAVAAPLQVLNSWTSSVGWVSS